MAERSYICGNGNCSFGFKADPHTKIFIKCPKCGNLTVLKTDDITENPAAFKNYKKEKAAQKNKRTDELLAAAKEEVRRLEKGIDRVLHWLDNEDTSKEEVVSSIHDSLINLYNGQDITRGG